MEYDVIYIEDGESLRELAGLYAERLELSYTDAEHLEGLRDILSESRSRIYVLDGSFPLDKGHNAEFNADKGVELIRNTVGDNARILLYSANLDSPKIAGELEIDVLEKNGTNNIQVMMQLVKSMLEEK